MVSKKYGRHRFAGVSVSGKIDFGTGGRMCSYYRGFIQKLKKEDNEYRSKVEKYD